MSIIKLLTSCSNFASCPLSFRVIRRLMKLKSPIFLFLESHKLVGCSLGCTYFILEFICSKFGTSMVCLNI